MMFRLYCSARQVALVPASGHRRRTLVRFAIMLIGSIGYLFLFLLAGYYVRNWLSCSPTITPAAQHYVLSTEHFIYKQKPLPESVPEENAESVAAQTDEDEAGEEVSTYIRQHDNPSLEARVKQAMAEIDSK
ncbi:hypothetical protein M8S10_19530 [Enterobacter chuandaensis]|uniref:hypothetical protein n=1 Tax=Enterobacter chuandaensis TaxID=2497875 RepID=UPI0020753387|nr:hypothetical protein [Enterobacter chuandaensis]MCM7590996.1 hypothetical protein [Enterobacter chuandaensis]